MSDAPPGARAPRVRGRTILRAGFILFALALFVATHWPRLRIEGPIGRPDLVAHVLTFGLWGLLLTLTGWLGEPGRWKTALAALLVGVAYAAIDEGLQAIPALGRHAALDDYLANVAGIAVGVGVASLAGLRGRSA